MLSQVATRSVYLDKRAARGMPRQCEVVGVSPLLRQLLILAVDLPSEYDPRSCGSCPCWSTKSAWRRRCRSACPSPATHDWRPAAGASSSGRRRRTRSICGAGRWA
jgi:hypothetical protein